MKRNCTLLLVSVLVSCLFFHLVLPTFASSNACISKEYVGHDDDNYYDYDDDDEDSSLVSGAVRHSKSNNNNNNNNNNGSSNISTSTSTTTSSSSEDIIRSATEAMESWLDNSLDNDKNDIVSHRFNNIDKTVQTQCHILFRQVVPMCVTIDITTSTDVIISSAFLLARIINRLVESQAIGIATHIMPLFLILESCSRRNVDMSPLVNFAIFPKLYHRPSNVSNHILSNDNVHDAITILSDIFYKREGGYYIQRLLAESVPSVSASTSTSSYLELLSRHLKGPKWDSFIESAGYNLALLQHYDGYESGARRTHEAIIRSNFWTWNEALRKQAAAAREEAEIIRRKMRKEEETETETGKLSLSEGIVTKPLIVLTCADRPKPELDELIKSVKRVVMKDGSDLEIRVLGLGRPFLGTFVKVEVLLTEVVVMEPEQLVLFLDAYDTLIFPSVRDLPDLYYSGALTGGMRKQIVFGAERSVVPYPDPGLGHLFLSESEPLNTARAAFPFLNSGTIVGTASALADMAMEVASYPSILGSDQRGYSRYYLTHRDIVGLDSDGRAFLTLFALTESSHIDLVRGSFRNDVHRAIELNEGVPIRPAVIHGNGGPRSGKEYYRRIAAVVEERSTFSWSYHAGSDLEQWVTIRSPPFTFAGLAVDGVIDLSVSINEFRDYVGSTAGEADVEALMYLAGTLARLGQTEEAQEYLDAAVRVDEAKTRELFDRARKVG